MCVDKRKGLLKDMWVSSKVTAAEVTCFDKVQDNNIACSCTSEPEVTIKAIGCSEQAECKVTTYDSARNQLFRLLRQWNRWSRYT